MSALLPDQHARLHGQFRWRVPTFFNFAQLCCGRWAQSRPRAVAIREQFEDGSVR